MRFRSGISRLIVFAIMVTLAFPFTTNTASAENSETLSLPLDVQDTNNIPQLLKETTSAPLQSDEDVLNYLEDTLITDTSTQQGIARNVSTGLSYVKKNRDQAGKDHYLYQKTVDGVPVYGEYARIHLGTDRRVNLVQNGLTNEPNMNIPTTPAITTDEAIHNVVSDVELEIGQVIDLNATIGPMDVTAPKATLMIYPLEDEYVLAYEIKLNYIKPTMGAWVAYVDAMTGSVIKRYSTIDEASDFSSSQAASGNGLGRLGDTKLLNLYHDNDNDLDVTDAYYLIDVTKPMFTIYTNEDNVIWTSDWYAQTNFEDSFPTTIINDPDAVDAHYYSGEVYDFYKNNFNWDGITGLGGTIVSFVNYEEVVNEPYDNAFWSGLFMVYGDGSGGPNGFNCLACAKDVVAHELTHAVTQYSADLNYEFESGALSESMSDIMAAVMDNDDWTIGEDTLSGGKVLRSLADPDALEVVVSQPDNLSGYIDVPLSDDNGGVHTNSGIPNHAAYLIATDLDGFFGVSGNGNNLSLDGRTILGDLTFNVLTNYLTPTSNFADARDSYMDAAQDYLDQVTWTSAQETEFMQIISDAWSAVGVGGLNIISLDGNISNASVRQALISTQSKEAYFFVPYGTNVTSITPTVTTSVYSSYSPQGSQNFTNPVTYTVELNGSSQNWTVGAIEEPILNYSSNTFSESSTNNGSISNTITVTLVNDIFTGANDSDFIDANKVGVSNLPAGLTAVVRKITDTTVTITLSGTAISHANVNDLTNVEVQFYDNAFFNFYDYQVTNGIKNLSINFDDAVVVDNTTPTTPPPSAPPVIIPTTPPVIPPAGVPVIPSETGPEFTPSKNDTKTTTNASGNTVVDVTLTKDAVDQLSKQLKADDSQQQLTININEDSDITQLEISAAGLLEFATSAPNAVIIVKSGTSSYQLPVGLLDLKAIAAELKGTTGTLNIQVKMEKITGEVKSSFLTSASGSGAKLIGDAIDFSIIAESNSSSKEIKDFGKTYVSRTIMLDGNISPKNASVVVFNPTTNRLSFVPATFKVFNGKTEVTIKRNGNSIYGVVSTKRIFFADVQKHWAADDIDYLASRLIIRGFDESTFKPNDNITRAQFTTMLVQALGLSADDTVSFSDIPANAWYKGNVGAAVKAGITSGLSDHTFMPDALITREQMAVMVANALKFSGKGFKDGETMVLLEQFADRDEISSWARTSVAASYNAGIIRGMNEVTFAPLENATRAQAAVMIRGLLTAAKFVN
ncbi:MAG: M4 family metallopeptidase [Paenibacillaceae bacterium]